MNTQPTGLPDSKQKERKPHYGRGMRKLRGVLDLNQKEMAARLDMTSAQLSYLEKKDEWSEEMLDRVSEKLNIPKSGLDFLANESDLLQYVIQHNTFSDQACANTYNYYNINNIDKADEIFSKIEHLVSELSKNTESMKKVMPKKTKE